MIKYMDEKYTPNQLAKQLIMDKIDQCIEFWSETACLELDAMTEKEKIEVAIQIRKRADGVAKYLGFEPIYFEPIHNKNCEQVYKYLNEVGGE